MFFKLMHTMQKGLTNYPPELAKYARAPLVQPIISVEKNLSSGEFFFMFDRCGEMTNIRYAPVWIHAMACF